MKAPPSQRRLERPGPEPTLQPASPSHISLEMIVGLESNSKIFTVAVQGLLELQAGQYTSIFVDNAAGAPITIQNGSDFMGMLLGA
ncbi:Adipolin Adipose-derived insulin-sensitizing factor [Takifugu flavidus]|uniref:Adipolin Adipose-derived insulin-sensitizing factor n=1 Tax=Takifugu flavidus TaxID=433684 RepID=A0A5C6MQL3_9TELE|nr:Adipolin Adipose-derived insulin-sensitizing factor [Takifugu flavidus]